jgi:osmotically-inducible protein OsmY
MSRPIVRTLVLTISATFVLASLALAMPQAPMAQKPADSVLKDRIEYRLETDRTVEAYDLKVKVEAGSVWLTGTVATEAQKTEATRLATVEGVDKVQNDIAVDVAVDRTMAERAKSGMTKTGDAITDSWITTKVKWFFVGEDLLKGRDLSVHTAKNVVTLRGSVTSAAGRDRAVTLAKRTSGVHKVVNHITIVKSH